jgi:uncharacterized protein YegP (UPF0339 family)
VAKTTKKKKTQTKTSTKKRATFQVYRAKKGHSWRLKINGVIIAIAGEQFTRRRQARRSIERLLAYTQSGRFKIDGGD